ncbi:hypothetical protein [Planomonospora parontospora]|uniref:hypothetical protein n=1 Tax=Planomonospora parontospora TaxID=58119 RepID=UPI0016706BC9|nr:hypothetical protein [Planomonospora parontospora]GGL24007.1 hypothetical protein GCM10014719_27130 [Planomonospora parontospora subsp. antibiotica]GII15075.1 hypothetical protein Ppa05_18010 [Planomonospora parontospora subsp. antibiotica]
MWFLDRTARQLRRHPALLTYRPPEPARLESLLRQYDPGLTSSGDWFVVRGTRVRWAELTEGLAARARVPADRRGAIIACGGGHRTAGTFLLNGLASRMGGALYPPEEHDDQVDVEVNLGGRAALDCEEVAHLVRPVLGERAVDHDHDLGLCRVGGADERLRVHYSHPEPGWTDDTDHLVDLELRPDGPDDPELERLYQAAVALAAALGGTIRSRDMPVTRFEDIVPTRDRLPV